MFKRIAKLRKRGKKKDKQPTSNDTLSNGSSECSDGQISEKDSSVDLRDEYSTGDNSIKAVPSSKSLDFCNNESVLPDDVIAVIPTATSSEESIIETRNEEDFAIHIDELKNVYTVKHADEDRLFREESKGIAAYVAKDPPTCEYAKLPQNREKNRYKNIVTSDRSRVVLERIDDDPFSDYINASYIDGYSKKKKFIATQGPKPGTVNDFWRMVWEQGCKVIVMVTDFRENGKLKCEKYFPETGADQYGNIYVECEQVKSCGGYHQRTLALRYEEEEVFDNDEEEDDEDTKEVRRVTHLQCKRWPDHGVPKTTSSIFHLYRKMLECQPEDCDAPILVHCSAGVGRTGTLIGLDMLIDQLAAENKVNVHNTVVELRKQRTEMVQGMDQYVLLHKLILEHYYFGETDYTVGEYNEHVAQMEENDEVTGKSGFEIEFDILPFIPPQNSRLGSGSTPQNEEKNRDQNIMPYEHSQVFIRMRPTEMRPPYINASSLSGYDETVNLIAAQAPLSNSIEDFWRVIIDNNVTCIVMLTPVEVDDVECCPQYWPTSDVMELGDITIQHEESVMHERYTETKLTILTDDREKLGRSIVHLHYGSWFENLPPPEHCDVTMLEMIARVDRQRQQMENGGKGKVLVHCSDGAGRTGAFCGIVNLIQRLKCENKIDVFRAVKDLRDCRPCMVRTLEEYKFCHHAISTYLKSFDLYSNGK